MDLLMVLRVWPHEGSSGSEETDKTFIHPSIHPFIHPSIYSFIHSSIHPFVHKEGSKSGLTGLCFAAELFERCRRLEPANTRQMDDYAMLLYHQGKLVELGQLAFSLAPQQSDAPDAAGSPGNSGLQSLPEFWVASSAYLTLCGSCRECCIPEWKEKARLQTQRVYRAVQYGVVSF